MTDALFISLGNFQACALGQVQGSTVLEIRHYRAGEEP
jgi:hypothetical protein